MTRSSSTRINEWFAREQGADAELDAPPMFQPYRLGELELVNRVVVSPMDMYRAVDGMPNLFHHVHLGGKALGGAGLVMTEMVCTSPEGRITPGCTGIWTDEQAAAWAPADRLRAQREPRQGRHPDRTLRPQGLHPPDVGGHRPAARAGQLGRRGPLADPLPRRRQPGPQGADRSTTSAQIKDEFVGAAVRADAAGFDLVELHCAHGYLLSSFISPLTNQRTDEYGGDLAGRLRFPLEVFAAMRAVLPPRKPMTVRISATDWYDGGLTVDDAVLVAQAFEQAGAAAIDVSTGQVTPDEQPAYGRSYQTPFADRIRNVVGIPTIAVGAISSYDDVNSILLAGRSDLCALARAHLYDPSWTLHAAADQEYGGAGATWPDPWKAGSRKPQAGRTDGPKPRLELIRAR